MPGPSFFIGLKYASFNIFPFFSSITIIRVQSVKDSANSTVLARQQYYIGYRLAGMFGGRLKRADQFLATDLKYELQLICT